MLRDQCQAYCQCFYCKGRKNHTTNAADPASVLLRSDGAFCSKDELYLRTLNQSLRGRSLMMSQKNSHKFRPDDMLQSTRGDFVRAAVTVPVRRRDRLQELLILENKERIRAEQQRRRDRRAAGLPDEDAALMERAVGTRDDPFPEPPAPEVPAKPSAEEEAEERARRKREEEEKERERRMERARRAEEPRLKSYNTHPHGTGVVWLPLDESAFAEPGAEDEPMDPALQYPGSTHNTYKVPQTAVNRVSPVAQSEIPTLPALPSVVAAAATAAAERPSASAAKEPLPYKTSAALWRTTNQEKDLQMQKFIEFKKMQTNADKIYAETAIQRKGPLNLTGK